MEMKFSSLCAVLVLGALAATSSFGDMIPTAGIIGVANPFDGDALDIGGDGLAIDDGWMIVREDRWTKAGGVLTRTTLNAYSDYGIGMFVTNSETASDNTLTFSFSYDIAEAAGAEARYAVYGITDDNGGGPWLGSWGDGVNPNTLVATVPQDPPTNNYTFTELMRADVPTGADSVSVDAVLAADYDYYFVGFSADNDTSGTVQFSNVSLVPEPMTLSLLGLGSLVALRRRRK